MVRFLVVAAVFCCCQAVGFSQDGETVDLGKPRTWTAATGHKLDATYLGREGNRIRLSLNDGQVRTILLENLSEADRKLVNSQGQEEVERGSTVVSGDAKDTDKHPYVEFLVEAKQKRLSGEEGVEYYQNLIATLYKQVQEYEFKYPKDFIKEDNSFNTKYLKKVDAKKKPISERKNVFTEEPLATPVYSNEPQWDKVSQEVRYVTSDYRYRIEQRDTLYAGRKEKCVSFVIWILRNPSKGQKFEALYQEDGRDYYYNVDTWVKPANTGVLTMGGIRKEWTAWCSYDERKDIFYRLCMSIDEYGKIIARNSEEGPIQFFASRPDGKIKCFRYPRIDYDRKYYYTQRFVLGIYDMNGDIVSPERVRLWMSKEGRGDDDTDKRSPRQEDPLNIFSKRNH